MNIPAIYHHYIELVGDGTGMADSLLHVHAGMAVLLFARLITRRSLATLLPFTIVCLAEGMNEILDRLYFHSWRVADTSSDIVNTLFWPAVLMIGLRLRRAHVFEPVENREPIRP